jgi:hypothetical protein
MWKLIKKNKNMIMGILIIVIIVNWGTGVTIEGMNEKEKIEMEKLAKRQIQSLDAGLEVYSKFKDYGTMAGENMRVSKKEKEKLLKYLGYLESLLKYVALLDIIRMMKKSGKKGKKSFIPFTGVLNMLFAGKNKKTKEHMQKQKEIDYYRKLISGIKPYDAK